MSVVVNSDDDEGIHSDDDDAVHEDDDDNDDKDNVDDDDARKFTTGKRRKHCFIPSNFAFWRLVE